MPGGDRLARWFRLSAKFKADFKNGITWLNNEDIAIYTTAVNYIEMYVLNSGGYENEIGKLISISLTEGEAVLDIGANIGLQSLAHVALCRQKRQSLFF